jgi:hypothetical protein
MTLLTNAWNKSGNGFNSTNIGVNNKIESNNAIKT